MAEPYRNSSKYSVINSVLAALKMPTGKANEGARGIPLPNAPGTPLNIRELANKDVVDRFTTVASDYRAHVSRATQLQLPSHLAKLISGTKIKSMVVPDGVPPNWISSISTIEIVRDNGLTSHRALANIDSVLTGCSYAVATTGTLALTGKADEGRRVLTLLPDHHFCVVKASSILNDVPGLFDNLSSERPITLISGPSATSDIELKRVEGVHGPRNLHIIVLED